MKQNKKRKKTNFNLEQWLDSHRITVAFSFVAVCIAIPLVIIPVTQQLGFIKAHRYNNIKGTVRDDLALVQAPTKIVYRSDTDTGCQPRFEGFAGSQSGTDCGYRGEKAFVLSSSQLDSIKGINKTLYDHRFKILPNAGIDDEGGFKPELIASLQKKTIDSYSYFYNGPGSDSITLYIYGRDTSEAYLNSYNASSIAKIKKTLTEDQYILLVEADASFNNRQ